MGEPGLLQFEEEARRPCGAVQGAAGTVCGSGDGGFGGETVESHGGNK